MDTLQLPRMLYERLGEGTWHDGSGGAPVTERGEMLHRGGQTSNQQGLLQKQASLLAISTKVPEIAKGSLWSRCRSRVCTTDSPIS